MPTETVVSVN